MVVTDLANWLAQIEVYKPRGYTYIPLTVAALCHAIAGVVTVDCVCVCSHSVSGTLELVVPFLLSCVTCVVPRFYEVLVGSIPCNHTGYSVAMLSNCALP